MYPILILITAALAQPQAIATDSPQLNDYLQQALEYNPALKAMHADWQAKLKRLPQASALDDPVLTFGVFVQSEMNEYKIILNQKFPWFGTLALRREKAALNAHAALERLSNRRNRIVADVRLAFYELAHLAEQLEIVDAQLQVITDVQQVVGANYRVGIVQEDDLLRVSIQHTLMIDKRDALLQLRPRLTADLNAALGADVDTERPLPRYKSTPSAPPTLTDTIAALSASNPQLKEIEYRLEASTKDIELARKKTRPDFTFGLEFMSIGTPDTVRPERPYPASLNAANRVLNTASGAVPFSAANTAIDIYSLATSKEPMAYPDNPDDNIAITVRMNLPIWGKKNSSAISEKQWGEKSVRHTKRLRTLQLQKRAAALISTAKDNQRTYSLYSDTLIPQARDTYQSILSQYSADTNTTTFLDVLSATQTILQFQLNKAKALRDWRTAQAELCFLTAHQFRISIMEHL